VTGRGKALSKSPAFEMVEVRYADDSQRCREQRLEVVDTGNQGADQVEPEWATPLQGRATCGSRDVRPSRDFWCSRS
jgi:hypothetical protein